ncbi:MAG TPA: hypothetical protein VMV92_40210 [Streptosporangiaceae bacterium]|nr:hypothetical protein [Streptosporangiaceae bacterium]
MRGPEGAARPPLTDGDARIRIDERAEPADDGGTASPAAPEETTRDAAYADRQLSYTEVTGEPSFDPLRNSRFGWQLVRRAGLFVLFGFIAESVIFLFLLLVAAVARSLAIFAISPVISFLIGIGLIIAYLVMPVPALLAQWSRLLGFRAAAADTAFEHISQAMQRHATPHDSLRPRRLRPPGEGLRYYLELRRGVFAGFISCFPHGRDLYVGWTFWIYMSPLRLMIMKVGRQIQNWTGRGNDIHQTLRYDSTRATIAALHACTMEGIDAAVRALDPGADLPGGDASVSIS